MKFDPMTGKPIEEGVETVQPASEPEGILGKVMALDKKILIGAGAAVAVVVFVIVALATGMFMSDRDRVMQAIVNTVNDKSVLVEDLAKVENVVKDEKYTAKAVVGLEGANFDVEYRQNKNDKQIWGVADIPGYPELEGTVMITDGQVKAATPLLDDVLFVYNYREDNDDGYLADQLGAENMAIINQVCEVLYDAEAATAGDEDTKKEFEAAIKEWYKELEVEKLDDKEEFEINGKDKKCTGYRMEITEDTVVGLLEACKIVVEGADISYTMYGEEISGEDYIDMLIDEVDGMPDVDADFYLDSNMLAAIILDVDGTEMEIEFLGGDYRAQNIVVEVEGNEVLEIEGETDGNVESMTVYVSGMKYVTYEYDTKNGDFEAKMFNPYYEETVLVVEGALVIENSRVAFEDGSVEIEGVAVDVDVTIEKGAEFDTLEGEEFDLGEASMNDFMKLLQGL